MEPRISLRREDVIERDGWTETGVTVEVPGMPRRRLWYRVRLPDGWRLSDSSDPFVLVPLYDAMRRKLPLHVEGDVSPSLLANLEEFQRFWSRWYRGRFAPVDISAERAREQPPGEPGALTAFSGGVDSSFTAYRHATGRAGRQTQTLRGAVMAHGFDIPIEDPGFAEAADAAEGMLARLGVPLVRMATNVRHLEHAWDDVVGAAVGAALQLLQPNARVGLIPGSMPPDLQVLWGSHPISDPLLSSGSFRVVHDGGSVSRPEKIEAVARDWPDALTDLRVCWVGTRRDRNCGRCGKCMRAILAFRAVGLPLPPCFDRDVTDREILRQPRLTYELKPFHRMIIEAAEQRGIDEPWVRAMRRVWRRTKRQDAVAAIAGLVRPHIGLTR